MEIRDPLRFELLSTLVPTEPARESMDQLAYSMDGRLTTSVFGTLLIIWDIQTGGVAKEIEHRGAHNVSLALSLNGSTIGIISRNTKPASAILYIYIQCRLRSDVFPWCTYISRKTISLGLRFILLGHDDSTRRPGLYHQNLRSWVRSHRDRILLYRITGEALAGRVLFSDGLSHFHSG